MLLQDHLTNEIDKREEIALRAENLFRNGFNCCESMLKSSIEVLNLPLPEDAYLMGRFFREGVAGSGCICGALVGGIMMLGFLSKGNIYGVEKAEHFKNKFIEEYGSTCCRVIRKKQSLTERFRNKQCKQITKFSAGLLCEMLQRNE